MTSKLPEPLKRFFSYVGIEHAAHRLVLWSGLLWFVYELLHNLEIVPNWFRLALTGALAIVLAMTIVSAWLNTYTRLPLRRRWQALGWAHYRQVLADMAARSLSAGTLRFDYVTHRGANFEEQLEKAGVRELQYCANATNQIDCVVFDIEFLGDFCEGAISGPNGALKLASRGALDIDTETSIAPLRERLKKAGDAWALPLRWGTTGIVVKVDERSAKELCERSLDIAQLNFFDIGWLAPSHAFHQWAVRRGNPCWLVALDWYLPTMLLFSRRWFPNGSHRLSRSNLDQVVQDLKGIEPLMHPKTPLFEDPVDLLKFVESNDNVVVIGGGNWLQRAAGGSGTILPAQPGWLLWAECLGFFEADKPDEDWKRDSHKIIKWLKKREQMIASSAKFSAFAVNDDAAISMLKQAGGQVELRHLPPRKRAKDALSRDDWESEWRAWKARLAARKAP